VDLGGDAVVAVGALGPRGDVCGEVGRDDRRQRRPHPEVVEDDGERPSDVLRVPPLRARPDAQADPEHTRRAGRPRRRQHAVVGDRAERRTPPRRQNGGAEEGQNDQAATCPAHARETTGRRPRLEARSSRCRWASIVYVSATPSVRAATIAAACVLAVLSFWSSPAAHADVVHLKGGRQLVGRVIDDGDPVRIEVEGGLLTLPRSRVERVERAELPEVAYERTRAELEDGDVKTALALATTAHKLHRTRDEGRLLDLAARWAPDDKAVVARLWNWHVHDRPLEPDDERAAEMLAVIGENARLHRSAHWRIAHDVDPATARACGGMLEATWRAYHRFIARLGLRPRPIGGRLEALLFTDHADWLRATGLPAESLQGLNGLFHGETGRILLFDAGTGPAAAKATAHVGENAQAITAREAELDASEVDIAIARAEVEALRLSLTDRDGIAAKRAQLEALDELVQQIDDERRRLRDATDQLDRYRDRLASWWTSESVSSALHEACHQVSFRIGLSRGDQPLWLNEGLATLFESPDPTAIVPEAVNPDRLRDVRRAWAKGEGGNLRRLIADPAYLAGDNAASYAEAWSLTHLLLTRHRAEFARFLTHTPQEDAEAPPQQQWAAAFAAAFGTDLDALEREWHRYVRDL